MVSKYFYNIVLSINFNTFVLPFPFTDGCLSDGEMSTDLREINGSSADSDESRNNPLMMSTMSTRNNSISVTASSMYSNSGIMTRSLPTIEGSFPIREYSKIISCRFEEVHSYHRESFISCLILNHTIF